MSLKSPSVIMIPQLKDNYCYLIRGGANVIVVDPAESKSIIRDIEKYKIKISAILITHHHDDHTAGIKGLFKI